MKGVAFTLFEAEIVRYGGDMPHTAVEIKVAGVEIVPVSGASLLWLCWQNDGFRWELFYSSFFARLYRRWRGIW